MQDLTLRAVLLALVPACTLYAPGDDEPTPIYPDSWTWFPDAARAPDARPWDGTAPCNVAPSCPPAAPSTVNVCGQLFDLETNRRVEMQEVDVRFHDALDFAGNPDGAVELEPQSFLLDGCGRFVAIGVPRPALGFLSISAGDGGDVYRRSAVAMPVTSGAVIPRQPLHLVRASTNTAWSTQAELGAQTFADRGVIFAVFLHVGSPVAGVTVAGNAFYFSDTMPWTRSTVDPELTTTGTNGAALILDSALVEQQATGGLPLECDWPGYLAASIPGVVLVQHVESSCNL